MASAAAAAGPPALADAVEHDADRCVFSLPAIRPVAAALPAASRPTAVLEYERLPNGDMDLYVSSFSFLLSFARHCC